MAVDPVQAGTMVGVVVVAAVAQTIRSLRGGRLRKALDNGGEEDGIEEGLTEIQEIAEDTYEATRENGRDIEDIGEAIVLLHRDDEMVDEEDLREKVGVDELQDDILERDVRRDGGE